MIDTELSNQKRATKKTQTNKRIKKKTKKKKQTKKNPQKTPPKIEFIIIIMKAAYCKSND